MSGSLLGGSPGEPHRADLPADLAAGLLVRREAYVVISNRPSEAIALTAGHAPLVESVLCQALPHKSFGNRRPPRERRRLLIGRSTGAAEGQPILPTTDRTRSMKTAGRSAMVVRDHYHAPPRSGFVVGINVVAHPCPPDLARVLRLGGDPGRRNTIAHSSASTHPQNAGWCAEPINALCRWILLCREVQE
jgi:hypothetical protein